jgi:hypothetical protein
MVALKTQSARGRALISRPSSAWLPRVRVPAAHRQFGPQLQKAAVAHRLHGGLHAIDLLQEAQVAERIDPEWRRHQQHAVGMGDAALDHQAPVAAIGVRKAQARQRPAHFHAVAVGQDGHGRLDREIRPQIRFIILGAVDAVADHAGGIDAHELGIAAMAGRVDPDADEVLVDSDLVASRQQAPAQVRRVVPGADAKHQRTVVDQHLHAGFQGPRGRCAVARLMLVEVLVNRCPAPCGVIQGAVDRRRVARRDTQRAQATAMRIARVQDSTKQQAETGKRGGGHARHHENQPPSLACDLPKRTLFEAGDAMFG